MYDCASGKIAYFLHHTKCGVGHNWKGTSAGAETDMLDEILTRIQQDELVFQEVVAGKDTSLIQHFVNTSQWALQLIVPTTLQSTT